MSGRASRKTDSFANAPGKSVLCDYIVTLYGNPTCAGLMINKIYNQRILELAANIPRLGRLAAPQASASAHSKLCGSSVTVDLILSGGRVVDFAHEVQACALGQASSAIMAHHIIGSSPQELRDLRLQMRKMLKENGAPPGGRWADAAVLESVRDYKARHASTLLTFDAVVEALDKIEAQGGQSSGKP